MTWFMVDDGVYDAPQTEDIPLAAMGLWVKAGSYVGRQMRDKDYDGTFDMRRLRKLGGTPKLVAECVAAGLFTQTDTGVYAIVQATNLCKFAGGADLSSKRSEAGRKGGKASGRARRSKAEANTIPETDASDEANASSKNEANASRLVEAKGTIPNHTDPLTSPNPSRPGSKQTLVSIAEAEARALEDPFETAWNAYPRHTGSKTEAEKAWNLAIQGVAGRPPADPKQLIGSVIAYSKTIDEPKYAPNMSRWLRQGAYTDTMPSQQKPYRHALPDGTVIDDRWITSHIRDHVPVGTFTDSMRTDFWACVKTGIDPEQKAKEIINECQRKAKR